ncbi:MAG: sulfurtransferase [Nitriliruptoraceae bacterium]|nr:sulfurtransferase [Nitriliruptoraceae bacterium]
MPHVSEFGPFIDVATVRDRPGAYTLVEMRWSLDGRESEASYLQGHLPGAVYVDLDTVAAGPPSPSGGRHPLPEPARFARALGDLGVGHDRPIVVADQGPGAIAARLVWMLRAIGDRAAVLDGGLAAWDGPLEVDPVHREPVSRRTVPWPSQLLIDTAALQVAGPDTLVLDARDAARYRGEHEPSGAPAGHLPGAVSAPFADNLVDGRLADLDALRTRYDALGALTAPEVVAHCGSGVTACHDLLVLEALGRAGKLYVGSWSAWTADPDRPVATGPTPGGTTPC